MELEETIKQLDDSLLEMTYMQSLLASLGFENWDKCNLWVKMFHFPSDLKLKGTLFKSFVLCRVFVTNKIIQTEFCAHPFKGGYDAFNKKMVYKEIYEDQEKEWEILINTCSKRYGSVVSFSLDNLKKVLTSLTPLEKELPHFFDDVVFC